MIAPDVTTQSEILRASRAIRLWSQGLRDRGQKARARSREERARSTDFRRLAALGRSVGRCRPAGIPAPDVVLPSLGAIGVEELQRVLVERHGFARIAASRAVVDGLWSCGYPRDYEEVVAADAFEIVDRALRDR